MEWKVRNFTFLNVIYLLLDGILSRAFDFLLEWRSASRWGLQYTPSFNLSHVSCISYLSWIFLLLVSFFFLNTLKFQNLMICPDCDLNCIGQVTASLFCSRMKERKKSTSQAITWHFLLHFLDYIFFSCPYPASRKAGG